MTSTSEEMRRRMHDDECGPCLRGMATRLYGDADKGCKKGCGVLTIIMYIIIGLVVGFIMGKFDFPFRLFGHGSSKEMSDMMPPGAPM